MQPLQVQTEKEREPFVRTLRVDILYVLIPVGDQTPRDYLLNLGGLQGYSQQTLEKKSRKLWTGLNYLFIETGSQKNKNKKYCVLSAVLCGWYTATTND